VTAELFHW